MAIRCPKCNSRKLYDNYICKECGCKFHYEGYRLIIEEDKQ